MKLPFILLLLIFSMDLSAFAEDIGSSSATVQEIKGSAEYLKAGSSDWRPLEVGLKLSEKDKVRTGAESEVLIETAGNAKTAVLTIRMNTIFEFKTFRHSSEEKLDTTLLDVEIGSVLVKAEKLIGESRFEVKTPTSIVGIRGTTFEVNVQEKASA